MKKAFSLIETMIAVMVIFVGLTAIVSIALTSLSNSGASKAKLKADGVAQGIMEKFRAARDNNPKGIAAVATIAPALRSTQTVDGITFTPVITPYYLSGGTSCIIEITISWQYKKNYSEKYFLNLTNLNNRYPTYPGPYSQPSWY